MKRTLFTICFLAVAGFAAYGQQSASASINVTVKVPSQPAGDQAENNEALSDTHMGFAARTNELDAVLSRGSAARAQAIYDDLDQMMNDIMNQTQSDLETANTPGLETKLALQKKLYNHISQLSGDLAGNQKALKTKLDEFRNTL